MGGEGLACPWRDGAGEGPALALGDEPLEGARAAAPPDDAWEGVGEGLGRTTTSEGAGDGVGVALLA